MAIAQPTLVTEHEFLSLPESVHKTELIDGEIIVAPAPTFAHQEVLRRLVLALGEWARDQPGPVVVGQAPLDVRFGPDRILQPDAFVLFESVPLTHAGPLTAIPALCVEILSGSRLYDRVTKRGVYALAGVREYWTVNPDGMFERWTGADLATREEVTGVLTSVLLPGFSLPLDPLFA